MARPQSIILFERLYLGALALGLINTVLSWGDVQEKLATNPASQMFGQGFFLALLAVGFLIPLILWYFIARKGSAIAKWVLVVLFAIGVIGLVLSIVHGTFAEGLTGILGAVSWVMQAVGVWALFRADTKAWFGEVPPADSAA